MSNLKLAAQYYKQLQHQDIALDYAWNCLSKPQQDEFLRLWRNSIPAPSTPSEILLNVPYYSQRDNYTQWERTCNSSTCAMVLKFFRPNSITGDDQYLREVLKVGDTTSHAVQTNVLNRFGLRSSFHTNLSFVDLNRELEAGRPVVLGILHKGTDAAPYGGHMIVAIGVTADRQNYICHDPWGVGFNYSNHNGNRVQYTREQLRARWTVGSASAGWGRLFQP